MRILSLNTIETKGGAAQAAHRLCYGLGDLNIETTKLSLHSTSPPRSVPSFSHVASNIRRFSWYTEQLPLTIYTRRNRHTPWSLNWFPYAVARTLNTLDFDIVHLHWVGGGFVPIQAVAGFRHPIVWTLHDSWAFTGGCHLPGACLGYQDSCGSCPQLGSHFEHDLSRFIWSQKNNCWRNTEITIVTPSRWLADCARKSSLFGKYPIHTIPNGLDLAVYKPMDKTIARSILKLPQDVKLILFGAVNGTTDRNKGFHLLLPALQQLSVQLTSEAAFVVLGATSSSHNPDMGFPTYYLGHLSDDISLALAYSAADVFVAPSLQENLPYTIMEALACGTPSVAFQVGGIPDLIEHQRNGYLAKSYDIGDLANGIEWVLQDANRRQSLSQQARKKIEAEFDIKIIAQRYKSLYEQLMAT